MSTATNTPKAPDKIAGVLVVTHDSRTLDFFDHILDVEDGGVKNRTKPPEN